MLGPLEVLAGGDAARALPEEIITALRTRWRAACADYPPAGAFEAAAANLVRGAAGTWPATLAKPIRDQIFMEVNPA